MSEDKKEIVKAVEIVKTEAVKTEAVEEKAVEKKVAEKKVAEATDDSNDDIFITEEDRFTVAIEYYLEEKNPIIKDFSEEFDEKKKSKKIDFVFKYPSQQDVDRIMSIRNIGDIESATMADFIETENVRLNVLVRSWSLEKHLSKMANLHPDCVKALRDKVTKEIGSKGIY